MRNWRSRGKIGKDAGCRMQENGDWVAVSVCSILADESHSRHLCSRSECLLGAFHLSCGASCQLAFAAVVN